MKKNNHPIVVVEWFDALNDVEWRDIKTLRSPTTTAHAVRSVGFLVHQTKRVIVLAHGVDNDGAAESTMTIPRDWCQKIKRIA